MNSYPRFSLCIALTTLLVVPLIAVGCSETTGPPGVVSDGVAFFDCSISPPDSTFVLQEIMQPVPGREPVRIELIGSNLHFIRGGIALDVAIRNTDTHNLLAPAMLWLSQFGPPEVRPRNSDVTRGLAPPISTIPTIDVAYGFDYSDQLGSDGVLSPLEVSATRTWFFENPELLPFSFKAEAVFSLIPGHAVISGYLFEDLNQNGIRDANEPSITWAEIAMRQPNGTTLVRRPGPDGAFWFPAYEAGLYSLTLNSLVDCLICVTTPDPLQVVLLPASNGLLQSFHHADFGVVCGPCVEGPVGERPASST